VQIKDKNKDDSRILKKESSVDIRQNGKKNSIYKRWKLKF